MMNDRQQKFFICKHCQNLVGMINNAGVQIVCCGAPMTELSPNTEDASQEKHVPQVTVGGDVVHVRIGNVMHPADEDHHIQWIYLETETGGQRKNLNSGDQPSTSFVLVDDKPIAVYAYCNLHGLWKSDLS